MPGEGNLLGNLLCSITGLLDPQTAGVSNLAAALNAILALVPQDRLGPPRAGDARAAPRRRGRITP